MATRRVYDVSPSGKQWEVKERGADRAVVKVDRKEDAVDRARQIGNNLPLAQVVVRKQDGTIQTEYTYGKDPSPPKG